MSSSAAGKFQDHYVLLGIDPKADSETIQAAYSKLAEKYRPDNPHTGNREKFDAINLAFEVLSDAGLRSEFDKLKGIGQDDGKPQFTGSAFFDALKTGADLRAAVLCILYDRRRARPFRPSMSNRNLEGMLKVTNDELSFALWYLKQRLLVAMDDKSNLQITVEGMDYLEQNPPSASTVLPFLKPEAIAKPAQAQAADSESASSRDSVLLALSRALNREAAAEPSKVKVVPARRS